MESSTARVAAGKLPTRVSASASVVTGELVASLPPENPASPFVVTQLMTFSPGAREDRTSEKSVRGRSFIGLQGAKIRKREAINFSLEVK
jgi:hypothetical protein